MCKHDTKIVNNENTTETTVTGNIINTEAFSNQKLVCINERCSLYAGKDLNNPLHVVKNVKNKI